MSLPIPDRQIDLICATALRLGMPEAARRFNLSVPRVSQVFAKHKLRVLMTHEAYDDNGKERNFKELRVIFNQPL